MGVRGTHARDHSPLAVLASHTLMKPDASPPVSTLKSTTSHLTPVAIPVELPDAPPLARSVHSAPPPQLVDRTPSKESEPKHLQPQSQSKQYEQKDLFESKPNQPNLLEPKPAPTEKESLLIQPNQRNLLISPVKPADTVPSLSLRPPSSRIAKAKKDAADVKSADEGLSVQFRTYPFPPSQKPLCYPLNLDDTPAKTITRRHSRLVNTSQAANRSRVTMQPPARKRLLKRWQNDIRDVQRQQSLVSSSTQPAPRRLVSVSASSPPLLSKRSRSTSALNTPLSASSERASEERQRHFARRRSRFELNEGDPVLPDIGSRPNHRYANAGGDDANRRAKRPRHLVNVDERANRRLRTVTDGLLRHQSTNLSSNGVVINLRRERSSPIVNSHPRALQTLWERMQYLKLRRRELERDVLDEIARLAGGNMKLNVSKEDRMELKRDIEHLPSHAVRDLLRIISRRMRGLEVAPQVEVQLQLDMLPNDLTREVKLLVMAEKGEVSIRAKAELRNVRKEYRDIQREYEAQLKMDSE